MISMAPLQLRLPQMVVRIYIAGRDNLVGAVDDAGVRSRIDRDVLFYLDDGVAFDEKVSGKGVDVVVIIVDK